MIHKILAHHKEHLSKIGIPNPPDEIFIPLDEYKKHHDEWKRTLPDASDGELHHKVLAHAAWKRHAATEEPLPAIITQPVAYHIPKWERYAIIGLLLLIALLLFLSKAHAQFSHVNYVNFQNQGTNISGAFFTYPFNINCLVTLTCTVTGNTLSLGASLFNTTVNYYVCVGSLVNCAYNGDGGQAATPSDSNACATKALPCATLSGVLSKISSAATNNALVTTVQRVLNVADTTGGTCFRPQNIVADGLAYGLADNTVVQSLYGGTESYPAGLLTIQGNTTTPANVKFVGAASCGATTPATVFGVTFRGMNVRITGIESDYYAGTSPANGASFVVEGGNSTLYLDHINATSNSTGYVAIGTNGAHVKLGPSLTWTNVNGLSLQSEASADTHTPAGDCTLVYSNSGSGNAFDIDEAFTHLILDGFDGTFNMSFSGPGAYNIFLSNEGHIGFFSDHAMALTFNAANATEIAINPGEFGWEASVAEDCGNANTTCTCTALAKRVNVVGYGLVRTGPTTCTNDSASTVTGGYWVQNGVINAGGVYAQNYNHTGTVTKQQHSVLDSVTLSSGSATVTFTGSAVFAGQFSYTCTGYDVTTPTNTVRFTPASGSSLTVSGTGSDLILYDCFGS